MQRKILLCGKGSLACRAAGYLDDVTRAVAQEWRVVGLPVAADKGADTWEPSFRRVCDDRAIETVSSVREAGLGPRDVLFSLQYDRIIDLRELHGARAFNMHFSALPEYRGCYPSIWPLRNGEAQSGTTLHVLTAGIDDGAIVDQQLFDLPPFLTAYALYNLYHAHGYEVFKRNLETILRGHESAAPQEGRASYYDRKSVDFRQREVNPSAMESEACVNMLRSLIFEPFQLPMVEGRPVAGAEKVEWLFDRLALAKLPLASASNRHSAIYRCEDGLVRVSFADQEKNVS